MNGKHLNWLLIAFLAFGGATLSACEEDGPLENAGEEIDDAVDGDDGAENLGEEIDDAVGN